MKGSIRERKPRVWNLCVELPPGPGGKRRQKNFTVYGAKRDAEKRLREIMLEIDQGKFATPGKITLGHYLSQWLSSGLKVSNSTEERYRICCDKHLIPALGHVQITKLTRSLIEECYAELAKTFAPRTILLIHRVLVSALNEGVRRNLIGINPAVGAARPPVLAEEARFLEAGEMVNCCVSEQV